MRGQSTGRQNLKQRRSWGGALKSVPGGSLREEARGGALKSIPKGGASRGV